MAPPTISASLPRGVFSSHVKNLSWATPKFYLRRPALHDVSFITNANRASANIGAAENATRKPKPYVLFDVKRCVPRGLKEYFPSTDIFLKEIDSFEKCAKEKVEGGGEKGYMKNLNTLDEAISKCINVHHGISDQFIYRSMYAAQLHHCFKVRNITHFKLNVLFIFFVPSNM